MSKQRQTKGYKTRASMHFFFSTKRKREMIEDESFEAVDDDDLREHFRFLRESLGHNFNSILNDPSDNGVISDWTGRLGGFSRRAATLTYPMR